MEYENKSIGNVIEMAKQYIENQIEYIELKALKKSGNVFANIITEGLVILSITLAFIFASITLGFWLSDLLESFAQGFGLVAVFYIVISVLVILTKDKYIEKIIINHIIKKYTDGQQKKNN